jgi:hypothetical protein
VRAVNFEGWDRERVSAHIDEVTDGLAEGADPAGFCRGPPGEPALAATE